MFTGVLLLIIGTLMILQKAGVLEGSAWEFLLPAVLIALGLDFVFRSGKKNR
ncbi:MAG: DUF5668 domain-containing protein [Candidatus Zixiibacteriota bacterium]